MEPQRAVKTATTRFGLGHCQHFFWLGVVFDTVGVVVLLTGAFVNLLIYDLLLYLGSLIILFSLVWWVFWFTGNIEMPPEEMLVFGQQLRQHSSIMQTFRQNVTRRFSVTFTSVSSTFLRIRQQRRKMAIQKAASLGLTVEDQQDKQLEKDDETKDAPKSAQESGDSPVSCRERLSSVPEDVKNSEAVVKSGSDTGAQGPCGILCFVRRPSSHGVQPMVTPPPLDQTPVALSSPTKCLDP